VEGDADGLEHAAGTAQRLWPQREVFGTLLDGDLLDPITPGFAPVTDIRWGFRIRTFELVAVPSSERMRDLRFRTIPTLSLPF
jgi:hypothetical protein